MNLNIYLVPLISGYLFITYFPYLKHQYQRTNSQRLVFSSIVYSLLMIVLAVATRSIINHCYPNLIETIYKLLYSNIKIQPIDFLWTSISTIIVCGLIIIVSRLLINLLYFIQKYIFPKWKILNTILVKYNPVSYSVKTNGDEIEKLFRHCTIHLEPLILTLTNGKVYIGFPERIPIPSKSNYLTITPLLSGYRDSETFKLFINTEYIGIIEHYNELDNDDYSIDLSIKQDEILTAGIFDFEVHDLFQNNEVASSNDDNPENTEPENPEEIITSS